MKKPMVRHFVEFLSPGTFVSESTVKPIYSWDVEKAKRMARQVTERYGATPYGFRFITRERREEELDSKVTKTSGTYYLGGVIQTLEEIKERHDPKDSILIANMESNHWDRVIVNTNSWKVTQPFTEKDTLLTFKPQRKRVT